MIAHPFSRDFRWRRATGPFRRVPADDPQRQYPILVGGAPVAPPPLEVAA